MLRNKRPSPNKLPTPPLFRNLLVPTWGLKSGKEKEFFPHFTKISKENYIQSKMNTPKGLKMSCLGHSKNKIQSGMDEKTVKGRKSGGCLLPRMRYSLASSISCYGICLISLLSSMAYRFSSYRLLLYYHVKRLAQKKRSKI